jgi:hypothetical protein
MRYQFASNLLLNKNALDAGHTLVLKRILFANDVKASLEAIIPTNCCPPVH